MKKELIHEMSPFSSMKVSPSTHVSPLAIRNNDTKALLNRPKLLADVHRQGKWTATVCIKVSLDNDVQCAGETRIERGSAGEADRQIDKKLGQPRP
jgi:hypothetical protein